MLRDSDTAIGRIKALDSVGDTVEYSIARKDGATNNLAYQIDKDTGYIFLKKDIGGALDSVTSGEASTKYNDYETFTAQGSKIEEYVVTATDSYSGTSQTATVNFEVRDVISLERLLKPMTKDVGVNQAGNAEGSYLTSDKADTIYIGFDEQGNRMTGGIGQAANHNLQFDGHLDTGAGDDFVTIAESIGSFAGGPSLGSSKGQVLLGDGNDTLIINKDLSNGFDVFGGAPIVTPENYTDESRFDVRVEAGKGNDLVLVNQRTNGAYVNMGADDDTFISGSKYDTGDDTFIKSSYIDMGSGNDSFVLQSSGGNNYIDGGSGFDEVNMIGFGNTINASEFHNFEKFNLNYKPENMDFEYNRENQTSNTLRLSLSDIMDNHNHDNHNRLFIEGDIEGKNNGGTLRLDSASNFTDPGRTGEYEGETYHIYTASNGSTTYELWVENDANISVII